MQVLELRGRITPDGTLEVNLPAGLPTGDIMVQIRIGDVAVNANSEILGMLKPLPRDEFLRWLGENVPDEAWSELADDQDAAEYVHNLRRQSAITLDDQE